MISTIMSAITTRMMEMKLKQDKLDRNLEKAIQQQKLKAYQSKHRNTSRGVGKTWETILTILLTGMSDVE